MANEIYNSSDWGNGVCDNAIDWGVVYKDFAGCTPSFTNTFSLAFDGVDDFVDCGNDSSLQITGDLSISAWFKIDNSSSNTYSNIITKWVSGDSAWSVYVTKSTGILSFWVSLNGSTQLQIHSTTNVNDGNWHHFLGTNDGSNTKLHIDGSLEATGTGGTIYNSTQNVLIGKTNQNGFLFSGSIDEVAIWNADKSSDVATIYNSGAPNDLTSLNPTAWYRNGDNGSYKSPQWLIPNNSNKDKVSNYSFEFDGVDDFIGFSPFSLSAEFTLSAWVKPVSLSANQGNIISSATSNANKIGISSASSVQVKLGGILSTITDGGSNNFSIGVWQHILIIRDSSNIVTVFRNGSAFGSASSANAGTGTYDSIGKFNNSQFLDEQLDEVAYWTSDQSSNVASIYNSGVPTTITGAVAHWKMGEEATFVYNVNPEGTWTIPDQVASNDGTSNNTFLDTGRVGDAPNSTSNAVSFNMLETDRKEDTPPTP